MSIFTTNSKTNQICGELFNENHRLADNFREAFEEFCKKHNYVGFISPLHRPDDDHAIVNPDTGEVTYDLAEGEHKKDHYHFAIRSSKSMPLSFKYIQDFLNSIQKDPANCLELENGAEGFKAYAKYCVHLTKDSKDKQQFDLRDPSADPAYGQGWTINERGYSDDVGLINVYHTAYGWFSVNCSYPDLIKEPANANSTRSARRERHEAAEQKLFELTQEVFEKGYSRFSSFIRAQVAKNDPSLLGLCIKHATYFKYLISDNVGSPEYEDQIRDNLLNDYKDRTGDDYAYVDDDKAKSCIKSESPYDRAGIVSSEETYDPETKLDLFAQNLSIATDLNIYDKDILAFLSHRLDNWLTDNYMPREFEYENPKKYQRYCIGFNSRVRELIDPYTLEVRKKYIDTFEAFKRAYNIEKRSDKNEQKSPPCFGKEAWNRLSS